MIILGCEMGVPLFKETPISQERAFNVVALENPYKLDNTQGGVVFRDSWRFLPFFEICWCQASRGTPAALATGEWQLRFLIQVSSCRADVFF